MGSNRNTVIRSMHDVGLSAWFGGALMGAVGVNGAAADVDKPTERSSVASAGWGKWSPVSTAAIAAHLIGGTGLLIAQRKRVRDQPGAMANTIAKTAITGAALAATAYSGVLGTKIAAAGPVPVEGATEPSSDTTTEVATAQRQLRVLQWAIPLLTGVLVILGAQQGEQQRPPRGLRLITHATKNDPLRLARRLG
ncbi:hypothetical protein [Actinokineospora globicatena]|uniref:ABC-type Mn/Zn transport systems, ATPase component n=1 Tax=Actinokineospora globicatena TaxID=103729 RepID=A0A9W6V5R6_9PSEU|nr:hypothetical protein [Actinokineospora globicatena]GLW89672.1 hypothetical protein Aglo03_04880 [Actinokineospora globicatena]